MALVGWIIAACLVCMTILIHYEVIRVASDTIIPWILKRFHGRRVMMLTIMVLMLGHIIEIWSFAFAMLAMSSMPALGYVSGDFDGSLNAFLDFSAANYTTLTYGDIVPHGQIRAIAVSEALAGMIMIAWSASFTYLKMEQIWSLHRHRERPD